MIVLYFLFGAIAYIIGVSFSYSPTIKNSYYYYPLGLSITVIANFLWMIVAKKITDSSKVMLYSFYWDSMTVFIFTAVPIFVFGARASGWGAVGLVLIVTGTLLTMVR